MTIDEFCLMINRSPSTVKTNWRRTQQALASHNIYVEKVGRGASAQYYICFGEPKKGEKHDTES